MTQIKNHPPKHIVITGASSGIGEALALSYASHDVTLSLTGRNIKRLEKVSEQCRALRADVYSETVDVADEKAMSNWLLERDNDTPINLIIANAGISGGTGDFAFETPEQLRQIFDVNVQGVFNTINPVLPNMITRGAGQIAIISSLAGFRGWPGAPAYCASKAAVKAYGEGLRGQMAAHNIRVNVICPGFVKSRMTEQNNFKMPFLVSADKAAKIIKNGLSKNKGRIVFPLPLHFFAWLFAAMPDALAQKLLKNAPSKQTLAK